MSDHREAFATFIKPFAEFPALQQRVLEVLESLPANVQLDFASDPRFDVAIEDYQPGKGSRLFIASPGAVGKGSRCVVLRPKLDRASEAFAKYVIAHEFAHAHLHNGGWGEVTDIEQAADALAASWGFDRPEQPGWAWLQ
ncbi:hypothetical protein [Rosistilla oblonga]|uniref:hypothetical protein n=1 Tax=Rosistilla oblonga TaxID=2527990 RepID=UPI003A9698A3